MGNGILSCKGFNPLCCGTSHYEINNNVFEKYGEMKLDKDKKIITNIFIPNCQLKISPEDSNDKKQSPNYSPIDLKVNENKKRIFQTDQKYDKESNEIQNNLNKYFNEAIKRSSDKTVPLTSTVPSISTNFTSNNKKFLENQYNNEFLEYLNKLRTNPSSIIEDINSIMNNNVKIIEDKDCILSEHTNEIIRLKENYINFDTLKDFLENIEAVNALKLNNNLKIKNGNDNIELTGKKISEIVLDKKREIIYKFPKCYFYPTFIKDIKLNLIVLLSNNNIKEKILNNKFTDFYVSTFNVKNNRFFAILCFA